MAKFYLFHHDVGSHHDAVAENSAPNKKKFH